MFHGFGFYLSVFEAELWVSVWFQRKFEREIVIRELGFSGFCFTASVLILLISFCVLRGLLYRI